MTRRDVLRSFSFCANYFFPVTPCAVSGLSFASVEPGYCSVPSLQQKNGRYFCVVVEVGGDEKARSFSSAADEQKRCVGTFRVFTQAGQRLNF